jgi:hypothetical protein
MRKSFETRSSVTGKKKEQGGEIQDDQKKPSCSLKRGLNGALRKKGLNGGLNGALKEA